MKRVECVRLFSRASWGRKGEVELTGSTNQGVIIRGGVDLFLGLECFWAKGEWVRWVGFVFLLIVIWVCLVCMKFNHKDQFCRF